MSNIQPANGGRGVVMPREVVVERIGAILRKYPELISFDPAEETSERLLLRCKTDPGPGHDERAGWEGEVTDWYFGPYTMTDRDTGELLTLPSLVLLTVDGRLIRFSSSEPALRSWLTILRVVGVERVQRGLHVKVHYRASQAAGRHYWQILPA